ncbi:MAG: cytochrome C oxidase subunit IV family protein [Candidatus Eisenbacteria bacterium]
MTTKRESHDGHGLAHVMPLKLLAGIWAALMVLTIVTVAVTKVDLGGANLWIALAIATVKASLVALFFMHLKYDRPFNAIVFLTALAFVSLFVGIALTDSQQYQPEMIPGYAPGMPQQPAPQPEAPASAAPASEAPATEAPATEPSAH